MSKNSKQEERNKNMTSAGTTSTVDLPKSDGDSVIEATEITDRTLIMAKIDSVSVFQIKKFVAPKPSIFEYYKLEIKDEVSIWSEKMFGRCCSEADMKYSQLLAFNVVAHETNNKYPAANLSDTQYRTAYAFKKDQNVRISLQLNRTNESHAYHTKLSVDEVLKANDTLLYPFRLSLVNGYVKSEKTFRQNGRVKTMDLFLNNTYKETVQLLDTPLVQEFEVATTFFKNDVIQLIPTSYYNGTAYDDICISEIQHNLGEITHASINKKYNIKTLYNRD